MCVSCLLNQFKKNNNKPFKHPLKSIDILLERVKIDSLYSLLVEAALKQIKKKLKTLDFVLVYVNSVKHVRIHTIDCILNCIF